MVGGGHRRGEPNARPTGVDQRCQSACGPAPAGAASPPRNEGRWCSAKNAGAGRCIQRVRSTRRPIMMPRPGGASSHGKVGKFLARLSNVRRNRRRGCQTMAAEARRCQTHRRLGQAPGEQRRRGIAPARPPTSNQRRLPQMHQNGQSSGRTAVGVDRRGQKRSSGIGRLESRRPPGEGQHRRMQQENSCRHRKSAP